MRKIFVIVGLICVAVVFLFVWEMIAFDKNKKWSVVCRGYAFNSWVNKEAAVLCTGMTKFNTNLRSRYLGSE